MTQQVSTSQNGGKGNTLDVPEYRVIGSAVITHLDLGKGSYRKHRQSHKRRMYSLQKLKPRTVKSKKHILHSRVEDPQQTP